MKRLVSLDYIRGIAIIGVVFFHALIFNTDDTSNAAVTQAPGFLNFIMYLITWAGMFAIISGFSNCISMYAQVRDGKITPKKMVLKAIITGGIILIINYLYLAVFAPGYTTGEYIPIALLPGYLRTGQIFPTTIEAVLFATALTMVAWGIIFTALLLFVLGKNDGYKKHTRNYLILFFIGSLFVWTYPFVQALRHPFLDPPITPDKLFFAIIVSWLVGPMDPIFPYVGFALYGAIIGMMLIDSQKKATILGYGYGVGAIYSIIGIIFNSIEGFWDNSYDTPSLGPLMQILGPMMLVITLNLHIMDLLGDKVKAWWIKHSKGVRSFGIVSLTAFILEGAVATIVRRIWEIFYPGFTLDGIYVFLLFAPIVTILWAIIIKLWSKIRFKGSFEWLIINLVGKVTGKPSDRLNVDFIIKSNKAYLGE